MSINIPVRTLRIRYTGIGDYNGLLTMIRTWIVDQGYEFQETVNKWNDEIGGHEHELTWIGSKNWTEYCKYHIKLVFHTWQIRDVESVENGEKVQKQHFKLQVDIGGSFELDYKNRYEKTRWLRSLRDFYNNYIAFKKITGEWYDTLYFTNYKLHRLIKEKLGMETITDASMIRVT